MKMLLFTSLKNCLVNLMVLSYLANHLNMLRMSFLVSLEMHTQEINMPRIRFNSKCRTKHNSGIYSLVIRHQKTSHRSRCNSDDPKIEDMMQIVREARGYDNYKFYDLSKQEAGIIIVGIKSDSNGYAIYRLAY